MGGKVCCSTEWPTWQMLLQYCRSNTDGIEHCMTPLDFLLAVDPVQASISSSAANGNNDSKDGKIPLAGGIILDVLLGINPSVFHIILGEPASSAQEKHRTMLACIDMACIDTHPALARAGTSVLFKDVSILWLPYAQNPALHYTDDNVFVTRRLSHTMTPQTGPEHLCGAYIPSNIPALLPLFAVTPENIGKVFESEATEDLTGRSSSDTMDQKVVQPTEQQREKVLTEESAPGRSTSARKDSLDEVDTWLQYTQSQNDTRHDECIAITSKSAIDVDTLAEETSHLDKPDERAVSASVESATPPPITRDDDDGEVEQPTHMSSSDTEADPWSAYL